MRKKNKLIIEKKSFFSLHISVGDILIHRRKKNILYKCKFKTTLNNLSVIESIINLITT